MFNLILAGLLLCLPFIILFIIIWVRDGIGVALKVYAITAAIVIFVFACVIGVTLILGVRIIFAL